MAPRSAMREDAKGVLWYPLSLATKSRRDGGPDLRIELLRLLVGGLRLAEVPLKAGKVPQVAVPDGHVGLRAA